MLILASSRTGHCLLPRYKARNFRERSKGDANKGLVSSIGIDDISFPLIGNQWIGVSGDSMSSCPDVIRERLSDKCIKVVVQNFASYPVHENIPARCDWPDDRESMYSDMLGTCAK